MPQEGDSDLNSRVEHTRNQASPADLAKYVVAVLLLVGGFGLFYWFDGQWPTPLRVLAVVLGAAAAIVVFLTSGKGVQTREFLSEARFELRKVVWPTRQEAMRLTWVVGVVVVLISLLLAGFDFFIQLGVRWLLGS